MKDENQRLCLVILDGWGHGPDPAVSAIAKGRTPFVDSLYDLYPNAELITHGPDVGLPEGQMGNSEVGHLNIGAGRVIHQELVRINRAFTDGLMAEHEVLRHAIDHAIAHNVRFHLMGLVSNGGVHAHIDHLKGLCDLVRASELSHCFIHAFTDGRDTDPQSGLLFLSDLQRHIEGSQIQIATVCGRYYAMDRDRRWARIKVAYDALVHGKGEASTDVLTTVSTRYANGETDEFLKPIVAMEGDDPIGCIQADDVVLFFNFRTDRPRQLTEVLTQKSMPDLGMHVRPLHFLTMTRYDDRFEGIDVLFDAPDLSETLGEVISRHGLTQMRVAETEKYPHVTFFFSGGRETAFPGEDRLLIPSPKVATYDLKPEMSAAGVTDAAIEAMQTIRPDFICLNYANTDMVGHTGVFEAAMRAAEVVDGCLKRLIEAGMARDYVFVVIADHGNSDCMIHVDGSPHTAHTTNPVPIFFVSGDGRRSWALRSGRLADVAPTILTLMSLNIPTAMTGEILLSRRL